MSHPMVVSSPAELSRLVTHLKRDGKSIALVPTMGALHKGHLALVKRAKKLADVVVVSIFVNPLQFGPKEDYEHYPRTREHDLEKLEKAEVQLVFTPEVADMYPAGADTTVRAGRVGEMYEGASRPHHFDGVLTVVAKLFNIVRPDVAVFGRKDAQQVFLVRRMARDLNMPVVIETVDTVRSKDGLAISSRNRFLTDDGHRAALAISRALDEADDAAGLGLDESIRAAQGVIMAEPMMRLDYLVVVDPETFLPLSTVESGEAIMLVAARVGTTRLIDNRTIYLPRS